MYSQVLFVHLRVLVPVLLVVQVQVEGEVHKLRLIHHREHHHVLWVEHHLRVAETTTEPLVASVVAHAVPRVVVPVSVSPIAFLLVPSAVVAAASSPAVVATSAASSVAAVASPTSLMVSAIVSSPAPAEALGSHIEVVAQLENRLRRNFAVFEGLADLLDLLHDPVNF